MVCRNWTGYINSNGYGEGWFNGRTQRAHRIAWQLYFGDIPKGLCVLHRCDNRRCVNPKHLFLGSVSDNNRDKITKGRHRFGVSNGEANGRAKLTEAQVQSIVRSHESGRTLGRIYGIHYTHINRIKRGINWGRNRD